MATTVDDIRSAASRMVDYLTPSYGGKMNALKSVARKCGTSAVSLRRFINGQSKETGLQRSLNIRTAYRQQLIEKIAEMQEELRSMDEADKALDIWDIDLEIVALETQLRNRVEGLRNGSSSTDGR